MTMRSTPSPLKRVFITGALVGALSLSALGAASAQDATATPSAPEDAVTESESSGFLGVRLTNSDDGVLVDSVLAGSPAEAAGILANDLITAVNGEAVENAEGVAAAVAGMMAGDTLDLTLSRDGETVDVTVNLAARSDFEDSDAAETAGDQALMPFFQFRGSESLAYNSADQTWTVSELSEDAPLYAAGLRAGDIVTAIDGDQYDPMALISYLASLGQDASLTLSVQRDGDTVEVTVSALDFVAGGIMGFGMMNGRDGQMPFGNLGEGMPGFDMGQLFGQMRPGMQDFDMGQLFGGMGQFQNGYLGVSFVTLTADVAAERGASLDDGALVVEVVAGSPAEAAGLLANDIVTAVNDEPVDAERTLRDRLIAYEPGDAITLTIVRDGDEQAIDVTLGEQVVMNGDAAMLRGMLPGGMNFHGQRGHGFGFQMPDGGMFRFHDMIPGTQATPTPTPSAGASA
jgi:S1-C subfamily serine protease